MKTISLFLYPFIFIFTGNTSECNNQVNSDDYHCDVSTKPSTSIFEDSGSKDLKVLMRVVGWDLNGSNTNYYYFAYGDDSNREPLLNIKYTSLGRNEFFMYAADANDHQHFSAKKSKADCGSTCQVMQNKTDIGDITYLKSEKSVTLRTSEEEIQANVGSLHPTIEVSFIDSERSRVALVTNKNWGSVIKLFIKNSLSSKQKKLVMCQSVIVMSLVSDLHCDMPLIASITTLGNVHSDLHPTTLQTRTAPWNRHNSTLLIRAAGYSMVKNLVYFEILARGCAVTTFECTPKRNTRGIVRLVAKDWQRNVLFTADQLPEDILAIYSNNGNLLGYQLENRFIDRQGREYLSILRCSDPHPRLSNPRHYYISRPRKMIARIAYFRHHTEICADFTDTKLLEIASILTFAIKKNSTTYKLDKTPLPVINCVY